MLKRARRQRERNCLSVSLKTERLRIAKKARRMTPAKSIREAVKNRGGECSKANFAIEKMLDQVAYIKTRVRMDMQ